MTRPPALHSPLHAAVTVASGWELLALTSGKVPPISAVGARYRLTKIAAVCGPLAVHLWKQGSR